MMNNEKGSVLITILAVFLIISLLFGSVILYGSWHKFQAQKGLLDLKASYLAEAGVNRAIWCLSGNQDRDIWWRPENYHQDIDKADSYDFTIYNWGSYIAIDSQGKSGGTTKKVKAILGQKPDETYKYAINLGDPAYPLVVTGNSRIIGDVRVGPAGVMPGRFEGEEFIGKKLVDGNILITKDLRLPAYSNKPLEEFAQVIENQKRKPDLTIDRTLVIDDKVELNYFKDKCVQVNGDLVFGSSGQTVFKGPGFVWCEGRIEITRNTKLEGGLILFAKKGIILSDDCQVRDCLLYSPSEIVMQDNCRFGSQAISDIGITVKGHATTSYPALLLVKGRKEEKSIEGSISIESDNPVEGILVFCGEVPDTNSKLANNGIVHIKSNADFYGIMYSSGYVTIEGEAFGCINTHRFYLYKSPTTYINWLKDALIDRSKLNKEMILPIGLDNSSGLEIVKYMCLN
ncbi:MAG TPA: hypothetical protein VGB16_04600 [candidate division Zixibacteria bacterium]